MLKNDLSLDVNHFIKNNSEEYINRYNKTTKRNLSSISFKIKTYVESFKSYVTRKMILK